MECLAIVFLGCAVSVFRLPGQPPRQAGRKATLRRSDSLGTGCIFLRFPSPVYRTFERYLGSPCPTFLAGKILPPQIDASTARPYCHTSKYVNVWDPLLRTLALLGMPRSSSALAVTDANEDVGAPGNTEVLPGPRGHRCQRGRWRSWERRGPPRPSRSPMPTRTLALLGMPRFSSNRHRHCPPLLPYLKICECVGLTLYSSDCSGVAGKRKIFRRLVFRERRNPCPRGKFYRPILGESIPPGEASPHQIQQVPAREPRTNPATLPP